MNTFKMGYIGTEFNGFYEENYSTNIPEINITITDELRSALLKMVRFRLKEEITSTKELYTIDDIEMFETYDEEKVEILVPREKLEDENSELLFITVQKEIEISKLQDDIANILLQLGGM